MRLIKALPGDGFLKWIGLPFFLLGFPLMLLSGVISGEHRGGRMAPLRNFLSLPILLPALGLMYIWHFITPDVWTEIESDDQGD